MQEIASDVPPTIPAALDRAVARFGDAEALIDDQIRLSWRELSAHVDTAGTALAASGVGPGDRVAIWAPNVSEWLIAAFGILRIGAVLVTVNTRFRGGEAAYVLRAAGVKVLFTVTDFLGAEYISMLREADPLPDLKEIVILRGTAREGAVLWPEFLTRGAKTPREEVARRAAQLTPSSVSNILFTSGTTGAPKGVMLTHANVMWTMSAWRDLLSLSEGDRTLVINPFFHMFGMGSAMASMLAGATIVPHSVFEVPSVLEKVQRERISFLPGPPTIYQMMLDHPDLAKYDTSTLRLALTGSAAVPVSLIHRMRDEMTFKIILTAYGLTESTGLAAMCRREDDANVIATTAGRALPGVEIRVIDNDGRDVKLGEAGEILVRGPNVMKGYFNEPEATADAIDAEGFLSTGDIGVQDAQGNVRITDRKKDMFIVGGFNVYPAEVENIMSRHPAISQAAVIGIADDRLGEVGMAYVVRRPGVSLDAETLHAWCRENMANFKVPRRFQFVDALPLNASGKVFKPHLRNLVAT